MSLCLRQLSRLDPAGRVEEVEEVVGRAGDGLRRMREELMVTARLLLLPLLLLLLLLR